MSKSILSSLSVAALAGGAMLALELSPASAFTLYGTSVQSVTSGQFDEVYYGGYGHHPYGYVAPRHYVHGGGYGYGHHPYGHHPYGYVAPRHYVHGGGYGYGHHPYGY
jgi:hypothetical protein